MLYINVERATSITLAGYIANLVLLFAAAYTVYDTYPAVTILSWALGVLHKAVCCILPYDMCIGERAPLIQPARGTMVTYIHT